MTDHATEYPATPRARLDEARRLLVIAADDAPEDVAQRMAAEAHELLAGLEDALPPFDTADPPPTPDEVMPMVRAYYGMDGNAVGGNLHIVLDDGNLRPEHITWCKGYADAVGDHEGSFLAGLLGRMEPDDLTDVYRSVHPGVLGACNTALEFWQAVEHTRFAGWGGLHEASITGYRRDP